MSSEHFTPGYLTSATQNKRGLNNGEPTLGREAWQCLCVDEPTDQNDYVRLKNVDGK